MHPRIEAFVRKIRSAKKDSAVQLVDVGIDIVPSLQERYVRLWVNSSLLVDRFMRRIFPTCHQSSGYWQFTLCEYQEFLDTFPTLQFVSRFPQKEFQCEIQETTRLLPELSAICATYLYIEDVRSRIT